MGKVRKIYYYFTIIFFTIAWNTLSYAQPGADIILSSASITENSPKNTTVGILSTVNSNGGFFFTYSLVDGEGDSDNSSFNISGNQLRTSEVFDFETKSTYSIRIQSSSWFFSYQKVFIITVIDLNEDPTDILLSSSEVPDNRPINTIIGTFSSVDPDIDQSFTYTLTWGVGSADNSSFNISGDQLRTSIVFSSEAKPTCRIRVRTTDNGGLFTERSFLLKVIDTDDPPVASNATIIGSDFYIGQRLTAEYTYYDADGDPEGNTIINWYISDNQQGTGRTLIKSSQEDTLTPLYSYGGKWIHFVVQPFDINGREGFSDTSEFRYINAAPVLNNYTLVNKVHPNIFAVGEIISAEYTYFDVESNPEGIHSFQWYRSTSGDWSDKQSISGADDYVYTIAPSNKNRYIALEAIPTATSGSSPGLVQRSDWYLVGEAPSATISGEIDICEGGTGFLSVVFTGDNPPWTFRYKIEGTTETIEITQIQEMNFQLEVSEAGTYLPVSVSDKKYDYGTVSGTGSVLLLPKPTAEMVLDELYICENDDGNYSLPVKLSGAPPWSISYQRNDQPDPSYISNIQIADYNIEFAIDELGTYQLLHVWDANCMSQGTGSTNVMLRESPRAVLSGDTVVCPGETANIKVILNDNGPWTYYYTIDNGDEIAVDINQNLPAYEHIMKVHQAGVYRLSGVENADGEGCAYGTATIENHIIPSATLTGDFTICEGTSTDFTVTLGGSSPWNISYQRNSEDPVEVDQVTQSPFLLNVREEGNYTISKVVDGNNCVGSGTGTAQLTVTPAPEVAIHDLDTIYTVSTPLVQFYAEPLGGNFDLSDENTIGTLNNLAYFFPSQAGSENSPHLVIYSYQDPVTGCYGRDTVMVYVVDEGGNIFVNGETEIPERYCSNQDTMLLIGVNPDLSVGTFSINDSQDALINIGNNKAYLIPENIQSGQVTVTYSFTLSGQSETVQRDFPFEKIEADFTWDNVCFTNGIRITLTDNSYVDSEIDSSQWEIRFSDHIVKGYTKELEVPFYAPGVFPIEYVIISDFGCIDTVIKNLDLKPTHPIYQTPYFEDFADGTSGWSTMTDDDESPVSWTFGIPRGNTIISPYDYAWYTDIEFDTARELSYVVSPCFDFSEAERPMIKFDLWKDFITNINGAKIEYKTAAQENWLSLGIVNEGINWYNSSDIQGIPGGNRIGWTGSDTTWQESRHTLDDIPKDEGLVRFRIAYGSPLTNGISGDGFAFDNFWIGERTKKVLIEHFTNMGIDGTIKEINEQFNALINNMSNDVIDLQYHMDRPGEDVFYDLNHSAPDSRDLYYSLPRIPYAIIDGGGGLPINPKFLIDYSSEVLEEADLDVAVLEDNKFDIEIVPTKGEDYVDIDIKVTSLENLGQRYITVQTIIIENRIKDVTSDFGETEFESVVRAMLPNGIGTSYSNVDWMPGTSREISLNYDYKDIFNNDEVRIVAFVQDNDTREVYQASIVPADPTLGIDDNTENDRNTCFIYPNPASQLIKIKFLESVNQDTQIQLIDNTGRLLRIFKLNIGDSTYSLNVSEYDPGIYLIRVIANKEILGIYKLLILGNIE